MCDQIISDLRSRADAHAGVAVPWEDLAIVHKCSVDRLERKCVSWLALIFFDALRLCFSVWSYQIHSRHMHQTLFSWFHLRFSGPVYQAVLLSTILQLHFPTDSEMEEEQSLLQMASNLQKHRKSWAQLVTRKVFFWLGSFSPMHEHQNPAETERETESHRGKNAMWPLAVSLRLSSDIMVCRSRLEVLWLSLHKNLGKMPKCNKSDAAACARASLTYFVFAFLLDIKACFATPNTQTRHEAR